MTDTIHLEGYSTNFRKQKIYCFGDVSVLDKMYSGLLNMYSEEILKTHKTVLLFSDSYVKHNPKWVKNVFTDAMFRIKDSKDLQLAYTYIQHCAKPLIIVWYCSEIPQVVFNNLNSTKEDITLITGGMNPRYDYSSIFFTTKTSYDEIFPVLSTRVKNIDIKSVLSETKGADVSLVYNTGSLYWFDYNSIQGIAPIINYKQASDYLRSLAEALEFKE
uniref:Uncharacterized protein n=1 Tax=viral metagenome TaxID=1070528 RepID=A0A6C0D5E5_9ZZZZ